MIRVLKTTFRTSKHEMDRLFACNRESAKAWNDCLNYAREYHKTNGKWIGKSDLQNLLRVGIICIARVSKLCRNATWMPGPTPTEPNKQGMDMSATHGGRKRITRPGGKKTVSPSSLTARSSYPWASTTVNGRNLSLFTSTASLHEKSKRLNLSGTAS